MQFEKPSIAVLATEPAAMLFDHVSSEKTSIREHITAQLARLLITVFHSHVSQIHTPSSYRQITHGAMILGFAVRSYMRVQQVFFRKTLVTNMTREYQRLGLVIFLVGSESLFIAESFHAYSTHVLRVRMPCMRVQQELGLKALLTHVANVLFLLMGLSADVNFLMCSESLLIVEPLRAHDTDALWRGMLLQRVLHQQLLVGEDSTANTTDAPWFVVYLYVSPQFTLQREPLVANLTDKL